MGYIGKLADKLKAQELRRQGYSYSEILNQITVSKDTLSRWCRDIPLSKAQQSRLVQNKISGQHKASLIAAENKRKDRFERTQNIFIEARKDVGQLSKRDRFIAGLMLYSGEGDKGDQKTAFTNSDPKLIKFMSDWFKEFCPVDNSRIRGAIWIHESSKLKDAMQFWSDLTGIPKNQFHKPYIAEIKKSKKIRKQIHPYGVFSIRFSDAALQRKILGWISAVLDAKIVPTIS